MAKVWRHSRLGQLVQGAQSSWSGNLFAPAFDRFSSDRGRSQATPAGTYNLLLDGEKNVDAPPADAVGLAVSLLDRQNELVEVIADAFWEEFHGRGPDSGMWWYDCFNRPDTGWLFKDCPIASAADVLHCIRLQCIYVRNSVDGWSGWVAHLCFWAKFEEEHDVGVLTDGQKVVGTGYLTDVVPYGFEYE